jgi:hypothetical protein
MVIENYTLANMMIGKKQYEVKDCELSQSELLFYPDNPRIYSVLRNFDGSAPSQAEIEKHMCDMDHVKQLKLSIKENGGLIDPLILRDGDFAVLEGNSRLAAYRLLCKIDPVKWGKVRCRVLPKDIDETTIFTLLGQYHIIGRKDWSPYEQAGYLYRRKQNSKIPIDIIARDLGIAKGVAEMYIKVFEYMMKNGDLTSERWSYYEEMLKNSSIRKAVEETPELEEKIVSDIQTGKIEAAADIRKIGKIAKIRSKKAKKVMQEYKEGTKDLYTAFGELGDTGSFDKVYQKVTEFRDYVVDEKFVEKIYESSKKEDVIYTLKKINKKIKDILEEINNGSGN